MPIKFMEIQGQKGPSPDFESMTVIPPNAQLIPGTVARIFRDEMVHEPRLQVIFAKFLDKDVNGQPRWKYR